MPQNMQKKPQVANLELDEALEMTAKQESFERLSPQEIATLSDDDPRYQAALRLLQRGNNPKKIATKLVKDGVMNYRADAMKLAKKVNKENPQEQITNAYILFGVATFFTIGGLLFIVPNIIEAGLLGIVQPSLLFLVIAGWFGYKGYQTWQAVK